MPERLAVPIYLTCGITVVVLALGLIVFALIDNSRSEDDDD